MNLHIDQLDYDLPERLIARTPAERRDQSRLMVVRLNAGTVDHHIVADLPGLLKPSDLVVLNDTRVLPARFHALRIATGGQVEGLYLGSSDDQTWQVLLRSGGKLLPQERLALIGPERRQTHWPHELELIKKLPDGSWTVRNRSSLSTEALLDHVGFMPLPPYIRKARAEDQADSRDDAVWDALDRQRYQTVYAQRTGAVAAPTAGLHLTEAMLESMKANQIDLAHLTLHVGMGTFQPVRSDYLSQHEMHHEWFSIPRATWDAVQGQRAAGQRIIAIGTTTVRALESIPERLPEHCFEPDNAYETQTDLMIQPGYRFRHIDGLLTNFHLPRSTLLALVAALTGLDRLHDLYQQAIEQEYRFYSYGDAMLILPE